jgi:penicillin-binding protein 1A
VIFFAALTVGGVFWMYSRDLPSHESLAQYTPPTISRIYSARGGSSTNSPQERRLFTPIEDIPDLVKDRPSSGRGQEFLHPQGL